MTDRHLQSAFLDLVDGHGPPHPEHGARQCAACRQAAELRLVFERDFDVAMREMAPQPLPPGILSLPVRGISRGLFPLVGAMTATLLLIGVAVAAPRLFSTGSGESLGTASPTASVAEASPPSFEMHRQLATEAQQPYFVDGVIDAAEYRQAVESTVACVRADGFQLRAEVADDGYYQYTGPEASGLSAALDMCREEHSQQVELAYQVIHGPTEAEMPAVRATVSCLRDAGHAPTLGIRPDQLRLFIEQLSADDPGRDCGQGLPEE